MPQILPSFSPAFSLCPGEIISALQSRDLKLKSHCRRDITLQTKEVQQGRHPWKINVASKVRLQINGREARKRRKYSPRGNLYPLAVCMLCIIQQIVKNNQKKALLFSFPEIPKGAGSELSWKHNAWGSCCLLLSLHRSHLSCFSAETFLDLPRRVSCIFFTSQGPVWHPATAQRSCCPAVCPGCGIGSGSQAALSGGSTTD